jgi:exonuclease III
MGLHLQKTILLFFTKTLEALSYKTDESLVSSPKNSPHTVCLTEHHLDTSEIHTIVLAKYRLGSKFCRSTFKNGGACIFTHKSIQSSNINLNEFCKEKDLEMYAVKLHLPSHEIRIITIYRSPSRNFQYFIDNLEKVLSKIYTNTNEIICGDININYLINSTYKKITEFIIGLLWSMQHNSLSYKNSE